MAQRNPRSSSAQPLVKIVFRLSENQHHGHGAETIWAEKLVDGRYRLDNSPFYVYGVSYGDIVIAKPEQGQLTFSSVAGRGGHSTYRLFLANELGEEGFKKHWEVFAKQGCSYEGATKRLIAIDVPPEADIYTVYKLLEKGEALGVWEFEEGYCGHPLKQDREKRERG